MSQVTHRVKISCLACGKVIIVYRREGEPMIACSNAIAVAKKAHQLGDGTCVPEATFNVETEVVR